MDSAALDYDLPAELIAQQPADPRDSSRLLVYERATGAVRHRRFRDLPEELTRGELVVVNDSRVIPARLRLRRGGGGRGAAPRTGCGRAVGSAGAPLVPGSRRLATRPCGAGRVARRRPVAR